MLSLVLTIIIVGVLLYCLNVYVPMAAPIKNILNIVVIICLVFFVLNAFGLFHHLHDVGVPQVR
jgi:hypothetical protein